MFIARQPIFNKNLDIFGYELLFRADSQAKEFGNTSPVTATATVLGGLFEQGIDKIIGKSRAFVNFDYEFLMSDMIELIDPNILVVEALETVEVDDVLIERLRSLRKKGYKIALDDFEQSFSSYPIVPIADIIKYDIIVTPLDTITADVKLALAQKKILLAEKIETEEEFQRALGMGFLLFQGYFFSKPQIVGGSITRKNSNVSYARILNELRKEEPSFDTITEIINSDVSLAYYVLRVLYHRNFENSYDSIKNALVRIGFKELERWVTILMMRDAAKDKPAELMRLSLIRSKFSEYIAGNSSFKSRKDEISMMYLFSLLDAILDIPLAEALKELPISSDVYHALVDHTGPLEPIYELLLAYEKGEWNEVYRLADIIQIDTTHLHQGYIEAIQWAHEVLIRFGNK